MNNLFKEKIFFSLFLCGLHFSVFSAVTKEVFCFSSDNGKKINFELVVYHDQLANWSGAGFVRYQKSKKKISIFRNNKIVDNQETLDSWTEVLDGKATGDYFIKKQKEVFVSLVYKNRGNGKEFSFSRNSVVESVSKQECLWR